MHQNIFTNINIIGDKTNYWRIVYLHYTYIKLLIKINLDI